MFCKHCGNELNDNAIVCMKCGCDPRMGSNFCPNCGANTNEHQIACIKCGGALNSTKKRQKTGSGKQQKSKMVAALLGFASVFTLGFSLNQLYLGNVNSALLHFVTLFLCGLGIFICPIEGVIYLCMSDEDFEEKYVQNKREWF